MLIIKELLNHLDRGCVASGYYPVRIYQEAKLLYTIEPKKEYKLPNLISNLKVKNFGYTLGSKGFYIDTVKE